MFSVEKQIELIKRGTVEILPSVEELSQKIKAAMEAKQPLVVKSGFDPTAPDIHLGHTVLLRKLRHFQELGHKVIFLIGDATALIGDPSGQSQTRKTLTWDEVDKNARTYINQVSKILNTSDSKIFERRHNSEWFSRHGPVEKTFPPFTFEQFVELAQMYTVARLLERDDFQERLKENKPITFLEFFYPLMQGYDSVKLKADIEIGGTDQKFNMLIGRDLQQAYKLRQAYEKEPQIVITMPILVGLDGTQKMSKSLNNYIGINETPKEIFGKVMSISDEMMLNYYELLTDEDFKKIKNDMKDEKLHPKEAKKNLAKIIVSQYCGKEEAMKQEEEFERTFRDKGFPEEVELIEIHADKFGKNFWTVPVVYILAEAFPGLTRSEARRKIKEGAVEANGQRITDVNAEISCEAEHRIRVGKNFRKVFIIPPGQ